MENIMYSNFINATVMSGYDAINGYITTTANQVFEMKDSKKVYNVIACDITNCSSSNLRVRFNDDESYVNISANSTYSTPAYFPIWKITVLDSGSKFYFEAYSSRADLRQN